MMVSSDRVKMGAICPFLPLILLKSSQTHMFSSLTFEPYNWQSKWIPNSELETKMSKNQYDFRIQRPKKGKVDQGENNFGLRPPTPSKVFKDKIWNIKLYNYTTRNFPKSARFALVTTSTLNYWYWFRRSVFFPNDCGKRKFWHMIINFLKNFNRKGFLGPKL